jgi:hypothetical protein
MQLHTIHNDNFSYYNRQRCLTVWITLKYEIYIVGFKAPSNKKRTIAFCVVLKTTHKLKRPQLSNKRASANISLSSTHGTGETGAIGANSYF